MDQQQSGIAGLSFQLTEDGGVLQAIFSPVEARQPLDIAQIRNALTALNYDSLFLFEPALADLCKKYATATEPFSLNIGERRDATVKVNLAPDCMSASVDITPAYGGRALDRQLLIDALNAVGVVSGILDANLDEAVTQGEAKALPVAQGRPPVAGLDASFESLVPDIRDRHPVEDEHGKVDLRNLGQFVTVKTGSPLMRRTPPTAGEAGENVLGSEIPAKPGKDTHFAPGLKGAAPAENDENLLVALISGQPTLKTNGVMVEPILTVTDVDLSTGYLDFEGSINISGDIKAGMRVTATGDVTVGGVVEAAQIHAGGDIVIKGGIVGNWSHEQVNQDGGDQAHREKTLQMTSVHDDVQIRAEGSLSAHFIENASVEAGNSIVVDEHVMQSELTAINQIVVGKDGSKKGHIVGGIARATLLVQTAVVGSSSGVVTTIEVGVNPLLKSKLSGLGTQLQQKAKQLEDLEHVVVYGRENPGRIKPEILEKTERTCESLHLDIDALTQEKNALQAEMDFADNARIVATQKVFGGVKIRIGEKLRQIENELGSGAFHLEENEIRYGSV